MSSLPEKLIKSAKAGNSREVRKLLRRGVQITKDKFGNTALHEAAWNGHSDIVKILLNTFCFVDGLNNSNFTPLHLASQSGHGKTVKTLLKWRADPTLLNQHGETALHLAAKYNHPTVISVFVSFKVNMDIRGKDSNTALHIAAKLGNTEALRTLLRGGANPHLMNVRGARAVEYADIGGFKPAIKLLNSKSKGRSRGKGAGGNPHDAATASPRLQRANSATARLNYHLTPKKQNSLPSGLTSAMQMAHNKPSPYNSYEEIRPIEGGPTSPKISPTMTPTIDQMLNEIEHEYHGPDYKYVPPETTRRVCEEAWVFPYKISSPGNRKRPTEEAWVSPYGSMTPTLTSRHPHTQLIQDGSHHRKSASLDGFEGERGVKFDTTGDYHLPPHEMKAVQNAVDRTLQIYETIPYRPSSDQDTYVYMAPYRDVNSSSPQPRHGSQSSQDNGMINAMEAHNKIPKRAIICSSPVVGDHHKHEPKSVLTPTRSILSQPSSLQQSEIDRYLQEELETMRCAFQIRLTQLEKRYQRQLMIARQRNSTTGVAMSVPVDMKLREQIHRGNSRHRRSSWHSCLTDSDTEDVEPDQIQRSGSSQGFDSDCNVEESDGEIIDQSDDRVTSHDHYHGDSPLTPTRLQRTQSLGVKQSSGGLKGGTRMWNMESGNGARATPQLPSLQAAVMEEEQRKGERLPPAAKALVDERVGEHKSRILHYFQQVSEAKIAAIEEQYEAQMNEVENRYRSQATEKLYRLENRVKDLEKMLDISTLV